MTGGDSRVVVGPALLEVLLRVADAVAVGVCAVGLAVCIIVRRIVAFDLAAASDALAIRVTAVRDSIIIVVEGVVAGQFASELAASKAVAERNHEVYGKIEKLVKNQLLDL